MKCQKADVRGNLIDVDDRDCAALVKPPAEEFCNVHNPCPGDGEPSYLAFLLSGLSGLAS